MVFLNACKFAFLSAFKMRILDAFKKNISGCVKNAKFAQKNHIVLYASGSLDLLCAVSYYMYKILLL